MAAVNRRFLCPVLKYFSLRGEAWQLLLRGSRAQPWLERVVAAHSEMPQHPEKLRTSQAQPPAMFSFVKKHTFTRHLLGQKIHSNLLLTCNRGREHVSSCCWPRAKPTEVRS